MSTRCLTTYLSSLHPLPLFGSSFLLQPYSSFDLQHIEPLTSTPLVRLRGSREPLHDSRIRNCGNDNRSHCLSANNFLDPTRLSLKSVTYSAQQPGESQFILPLLAKGCNRPSNLSGAQQPKSKHIPHSLTSSPSVHTGGHNKLFRAFREHP